MCVHVLDHTHACNMHRLQGRHVIFSDAQARKVIFETACNMDIVEFCKYMKYNSNVTERRHAFAQRLYHKIRRKYFGGFDMKYVMHVLVNLARTGGPNAVWNFIDKKVQSSAAERHKWMKWRDAIIEGVKVVLTKAHAFANELDEFPLTNAHRGKILGQFAAGLQRTVDDEVTPSPFSHEVRVHTLRLVTVVHEQPYLFAIWAGFHPPLTPCRHLIESPPPDNFDFF